MRIHEVIKQQLEETLRGMWNLSLEDFSENLMPYLNKRLINTEYKNVEEYITNHSHMETLGIIKLSQNYKNLLKAEINLTEELGLFYTLPNKNKKNIGSLTPIGFVYGFKYDTQWAHLIDLRGLYENPKAEITRLQKLFDFEKIPVDEFLIPDTSTIISHLQDIHETRSPAIDIEDKGYERLIICAQMRDDPFLALRLER